MGASEGAKPLKIQEIDLNCWLSERLGISVLERVL
jgi:hypothetical protein